jgi:hypothetical protein
MNAVINPLQPVLDLLNAAFGTVDLPRAEVSEEQRRADLEADLRDAERQEFVAKRKPELVRQYMRDDAKMDAAIAYAASQVSVGMRLALRNGDDFEFTRLIRARVGVYMHDQAADAAEDEGYVMHPELPL